MFIKFTKNRGEYSGFCIHIYLSGLIKYSHSLRRVVENKYARIYDDTAFITDYKNITVSNKNYDAVINVPGNTFKIKLEDSECLTSILEIVPEYVQNMCEFQQAFDDKSRLDVGTSNFESRIVTLSTNFTKILKKFKQVTDDFPVTMRIHNDERCDYEKLTRPSKI